MGIAKIRFSSSIETKFKETEMTTLWKVNWLHWQKRLRSLSQKKALGYEQNQQVSLIP